MKVPRFIPISSHASNLDRTACLVSGSRELISVYRVQGGYCGAFYPLGVLEGLFETETAARDALRLAMAGTALEPA